MSSNTEPRRRVNNATGTAIHSVFPASSFANTPTEGYLPEIKQQIADMAINGSDVRDTSRLRNISPATVIEELKKVLILSAS